MTVIARRAATRRSNLLRMDGIASGLRALKVLRPLAMTCHMHGRKLRRSGRLPGADMGTAIVRTGVKPKAALTTTTTPRQSVVGRLRRMPAVVGPLLILIGLCIVITLITPRFFSATNLAGVARQSAYLLIAAMGVSLVIMMGGIDLSVEGVMASSSVIASLLVACIKPETGAVETRPNFNIGILGIPGRGRRRHADGAGQRTAAHPAAHPFLYGDPRHAVGRHRPGNLAFRRHRCTLLDPFLRGLARDSIGPIPNLAVFGLVIFFVALFLERYTRFGRYIRAIGGAEDRAKLVGIPVDRYKVLAFTIAGLFYGIAGVLSTGRAPARPTSARASCSLPSPWLWWAGPCCTGGTGGVVQTLIGVLIVIVISNGMIMVGVNNWIQLAVQGVIITIAVALTMDRKKIPIIK